MKRLGYLSLYILFISIPFALIGQVSIQFDGHLSDQAKQCIYGHANGQYLAEQALAQSAQLMQKCLAIKDISIQRATDDDTKVTVISAEPYALINEMYVLNKDGKIVDAQLYAHTETLPQVQTKNSNSNLSPLCKRFLLSIPHELLCEYDVEWENGVNIRLYDKKQPFFIVTCSASTPPNELTHEACEKIKGILKDRGQLGKEPLEAWDADIRFDKQIIVSKK